jgi:hypothetical protein
MLFLLKFLYVARIFAATARQHSIPISEVIVSATVPIALLELLIA